MSAIADTFKPRADDWEGWIESSDSDAHDLKIVPKQIDFTMPEVPGIYEEWQQRKSGQKKRYSALITNSP